MAAELNGSTEQISELVEVSLTSAPSVSESISNDTSTQEVTVVQKQKRDKTTFLSVSQVDKDGVPVFILHKGSTSHQGVGIEVAMEHSTLREY